MRWSFARYMSPEDRLSLLQRRRAQLVAAREGSRRAVESPWRPLDRYQRSLVEHANEATEHDLTWIDRLISAEQVVPPSSTSVPRVLPASATEAPPPVTNAPAVQGGPALKLAAHERTE